MGDLRTYDAHPSNPTDDEDVIPSGRGVFRRRIVVYVNLLFLATMLVFVTASFLSEKRLHYRETFEHLDETLGVLSFTIPRDEIPSPNLLATLEAQIEQRTRVQHRVVITDSHYAIVASSDQSLVGRDIRTAYDVKPYGDPESSWALASRHTGGWLIASAVVPMGREGEGRIFLMRWRHGSEQFIAKFIGLHGVHVVVTVALFTLVLHALGARRVRDPIERLAAYVRRVESGDFTPASEMMDNGDEFGWLAGRFARMGLNLNQTVSKLVRAEKQATAAVMALRVAREMKEPLESLKRHILYLESLAEVDPEMREVCGRLRQDRHRVVKVIRRLNEIDLPKNGKEAKENRDEIVA